MGKKRLVGLLTGILVVLASVAVTTPATLADTALGCYPNSGSDPLAIDKGSRISCFIGDLPGATVSWTSSGFSPRSSSKMRQEFKATGSGSAWIKMVLDWEGVYTETYRYQIGGLAGGAPVLLNPWFDVDQKVTKTWGQTGCGQASTTMVLQHFFGRNSFTMAQVEAVLDTNRYAFIGNIPGVLQSLSGNRLTAGNTSATAGDAKAALWSRISSGQPVITLIANVSGLPKWGSQTLSHYVVVYGYDRRSDTVYYDDPYWGKRTASWDVFRAAWGSTNPPNVNYPYQYVWAQRQ